MGWKPGDPPKGRRPLHVVPDPEPVTEPVTEPKPRRRRSPRRRGAGAESPPEKMHRQVAEARPAAGLRTDTHDAVTIELGKRWSNIVREVRDGKYTWQQFAEGLSDEELARGQLKADDGSFKGRPPALVPREFHLVCFRELKRRFDELFQKDVIEMAKQYVELAKNADIPAKDRAKLMQYAMERVFGGIPKEVLVKQDAPWESVVTSIVNTEDQSEAAGAEDRYSGRYDDEE